MKMDGQESVDSYGHNTKERGITKQKDDDVKRGSGGISRIDHQSDEQRLNK